MPLVRQAAALALAAATTLVPLAAAAGCSTASTGARCVSVPVRPAMVEDASLTGSSAPSPEVAVGDVLARGRHSILLNADYYGLPPVSDGWVYMRVGRDVFRVDWRSQQVLERVTDRAAANF